MIKKVMLLLIMLLIVVISGCGKPSVKETPADSNAFLSITDDGGRKVVLKNKPERVVSLSPSFLGMIDAVGGKVIGRATSKIGTIPESMKEAQEVGFTYNIDIEKVVALKPDCVLALKGQHDKFISLLEANNIPVIEIDLRTYKEVQSDLKLIGKIYGVAQKGEQESEKLNKEMNDIADKLPKNEKRIVILHASPKNVTVELDGTIAGSVAKLLGFKNVASGSTPLSGDPDKTPYSLEELVKNDPEIIFITSMGNIEAVENRLRADVKNNPAWNSLKAVREDKIIFLPEQLFLINPGMQYPKAVEYMAKTVYPEVFSNAK
ncbi:MAG: ABC transporter substrate-binding protein [Acidaminococcaceae bacterium]